MLIVFTSRAVDRGFDHWQGHTNDYKIGIYCFSGKHTALWSKIKHWLARNQNNMSELSYMSIRGLPQHYQNPTQRVRLVHKTSLSPPRYIEVLCPIQESEQPWIKSIDFASYYSFSNGLWNCSDSVIFFFHFISTIFLLAFRTVPIVKYFLSFYFYDFSNGFLELLWQCSFYLFYFLFFVSFFILFLRFSDWIFRTVLMVKYFFSFAFYSFQRYLHTLVGNQVFEEVYKEVEDLRRIADAITVQQTLKASIHSDLQDFEQRRISFDIQLHNCVTDVLWRHVIVL